MSNFENYDFILHDGVVIENEKADKEGRKKRMSAMCVKFREQTNMNRKEFAEWLGIPYRTMQDWAIPRATSRRTAGWTTNTLSRVPASWRLTSG